MKGPVRANVLAFASAGTGRDLFWDIRWILRYLQKSVNSLQFARYAIIDWMPVFRELASSTGTPSRRWPSSDEPAIAVDAPIRSMKLICVSRLPSDKRTVGLQDAPAHGIIDAHADLK
jgi:hypothetical protein